MNGEIGLRVAIEVQGSQPNVPLTGTLKIPVLIVAPL